MGNHWSKKNQYQDEKKSLKAEKQVLEKEFPWTRDNS